MSWVRPAQGQSTADVDRDVNRSAGTPIETNDRFVEENVTHYIVDVEH